MMDDRIDKQIVKLYGKSPKRAFSLLFDEYYQRLYWHIRSIVLNHQDAHDVSQECMLKVYKHLGSYRGESKLYTWLHRIATNEALDFLRKQKRRRTENWEDHKEWIEERADDAFMEGSDIKELLIEALDLLPEKQKLAFQLRYFGGKSYAEIAEITGTIVGGLKANYHHAVQKITEYIQSKVIQ